MNVGGLLRLLNASMETSAPEERPHFVAASTSSVYGATDRIPFVEDDSCDRPLAPYSASKRAAELIGYSYNNLHGMKFTFLRFFTVYGPRNRPDMMAFKLLDSVFAGRQVALYEGKEIKRDWTFVDDVVDGVVRADRQATRLRTHQHRPRGARGPTRVRSDRTEGHRSRSEPDLSAHAPRGHGRYLRRYLEGSRTAGIRTQHLGCRRS